MKSIKSPKSSKLEPVLDFQKAFEISNQPQIITTVSTGKVTIANSAACKLLGYSAKEILTKKRTNIFNTREVSFKKMFQERKDIGHSLGRVTVFLKNGKSIFCDISTSIFIDDKGIGKAIIVLAEEQKKQTSKGTLLAINQEKDLLKFIGETSYDVMWNWDIEKQQVYLGESIKEVFGYNIKSNLMGFRDVTRLLLPKERQTVYHKLSKVLASKSKSWKDSFDVLRFDGSIASTNCRACIVRDKTGKAVRLIGAIQDISRLLELERHVEEQGLLTVNDNDLLSEVSKLTFDGIWDWDPNTNEFNIGEGFDELYCPGGKTVDIKTFEDWLKSVHTEDRNVIEKGLLFAAKSNTHRWEQSFRFRKSDGTAVKVLGRAAVIRDSEGRAIRFIGTIQDVSRQKELEKKLEQEVAFRKKMISEYEENFRLIFNSSSDVLYDVDILADEVDLSEAFEKEFGHKTENGKLAVSTWFSHIHEEDKDAFLKDYARMLASEDVEWKWDFRYVRFDGTVAHVSTSGMVLRNLQGQPYRRIGYMQDVSKNMILEEKLRQEVELRETQIELTAQEAKEIERSTLGKELHDNVNQLLGASKLYLEMAKKGGPNSKIYLIKSSQYTCTAIDEIRKLTHGLAGDFINNLGLSESIEFIINDIMEIQKIKITWVNRGFDEARVNHKFKLTIFRIIQEQLNNILKHAKATQISIILAHQKDQISLSVKDNGIGFDTTLIQKGIGLANLKGRASLYRGKIDFVSQPRNGCVLNVEFPISELISAN